LIEMKKAMMAGSAAVLLSVSAWAQSATQSPAQAEATQPLAQAPSAKVAEPFPPVNLKNFTAASPSREDVDAFLKQMWGYDENRLWSVAAVQSTPAPGVSRVVVFIKEKTQPDKENSSEFYVTPDGKHAIAGAVIPFGVKPFAENKQLMIDKADGPAHGAAGKDLLIVEFADMQCPHCKEFEATMDKIAMDFPQARIVFMNYPIAEIHPWAQRAAEEGVCVRKEKGDAAFFTYLQAVFDAQTTLTPQSGTATLDESISKAGADPAKVKACAALPATRAEVDAEKQLGVSAGVDQTPEIFINGRLVPASQIPYETLKKMIIFQAQQDGLNIKVQPSLNTLK
jgi:protein-disulfide isomerase